MGLTKVSKPSPVFTRSKDNCLDYAFHWSRVNLVDVTSNPVQDEPKFCERISDYCMWRVKSCTAEQFWVALSIHTSHLNHIQKAVRSRFVMPAKKPAEITPFIILAVS